MVTQLHQKPIVRPSFILYCTRPRSFIQAGNPGDDECICKISQHPHPTVNFSQRFKYSSVYMPKNHNLCFACWIWHVFSENSLEVFGNLYWKSTPFWKSWLRASLHGFYSNKPCNEYSLKSALLKKCSNLLFWDYIKEQINWRWIIIDQHLYFLFYSKFERN